MGDRVACNLSLHGEVKASQVAEITKAIEDDYGEVNDGSLVNGAWFDEVNYAEMPPLLASVLRALNLSWCWTWSAGSDYPEGMSCCDAERDERISFVLSSGEIVLTLAESQDAKYFEQARRWDEWVRSTPIKIVELTDGMKTLINSHLESIKYDTQRCINGLSTLNTAELMKDMTVLESHLKSIKSTAMITRETWR